MNKEFEIQELKKEQERINSQNTKISGILCVNFFLSFVLLFLQFIDVIPAMFSNYISLYAALTFAAQTLHSVISAKKERKIKEKIEEATKLSLSNDKNVDIVTELAKLQELEHATSEQRELVVDILQKEDFKSEEQKSLIQKLLARSDTKIENEEIVPNQNDTYVDDNENIIGLN